MRVYFNGGGAEIVNDEGRRERIQYIDVPVDEQCCRLNCCGGTPQLEWTDATGTAKTVTLDDIWDLVNP